MKTVLAPIDFYPISKLVVTQAAALAQAMGARLVLLNVIAPGVVQKAEAADTNVEGGYVLRAEQSVQGELRKLQQRLRDDGITAHTVHRIGAAGPQILEQAERLDADCIVMGSHGHGALYDLLAGSTTTRVLKGTRCPVVIVPVGAKGKDKQRVSRRRRVSDAQTATATAATR